MNILTEKSIPTLFSGCVSVVRYLNHVDNLHSNKINNVISFDKHLFILDLTAK